MWWYMVKIKLQYVYLYVKLMQHFIINLKLHKYKVTWFLNSDIINLTPDSKIGLFTECSLTITTSFSMTEGIGELPKDISKF